MGQRQRPAASGASCAARPIRLDGCSTELMPGEADVWGCSVMLRRRPRAARTNGCGYVALGDQDRSLWDSAQIAEGLRALERGVRFRHPGQYQLQAAITALHIQASDPDAADWSQIADLYAALGKLSPSPVVEVNHAAAVGLAHGPQAGLELLRPLLAAPALRQYQPLHATHAELLSRASRGGAAAQAYRRAITLTQNAVARAELERRLDGLTQRATAREK